MKNIIIIHADSTQPTKRDLVSGNFWINFKISFLLLMLFLVRAALPYYLLLLSMELKCNYVVKQLSMVLHTFWGQNPASQGPGAGARTGAEQGVGPN